MYCASEVVTVHQPSIRAREAADITLKAGIERMIKEELPEIEEVLDTTDHASGENPYTPGK